jgi:AcrR family transcriptional regulator
MAIRPEKTEARQEQLLTAAAGCFAERGYHDTQVSDIIAAAGVARGTFYNYFDSKRAVFSTLLNDLIAQLSAAVAPIDLAAAEPPLAQLRANFRNVIGLIRAHPVRMKLVLVNAGGLDEEFDAELTTFRAGIVEYIESSLTIGAAIGLVRASNSMLAARGLFGLVQEIARAIVDEPGLEPDDERVIDEVMGLVLSGVALPVLRKSLPELNG